MTPLRTTVIGSYPFPGWLEHAASRLDEFGPDDIAELQEDAVIAAVHDQVAAGLDTISDGEQTRLDFNLGFYGFIEGIEQGESPRRFGPPAHDQRAQHRLAGELAAPRGLGTGEELAVGPPHRAPTVQGVVEHECLVVGEPGAAVDEEAAERQRTDVGQVVQRRSCQRFSLDHVITIVTLALSANGG